MDAFADDSDRFSLFGKRAEGYNEEEPEKSHTYRDDDRRDRQRDDRRDRDSRRDYDRDRNRDSESRGTKRSRNDDSYRRREEDEPPPELFSIHKGRVASIQSYGVFVEMENYRRHGLVHISQATNTRLQGKEDLEQVWSVGDPIWVKVIGIGEDKKISLSAKYVNQGSGKDLDVNQVDLTMSDRRKKPGWQERGPIQLDAVLHTNCTRCGGKGHIAAECYTTKGQKGYELVEEKDEPEEPKKVEAKEHKKEKKEKKEKKHKKHKKEKKDKEHKKHKKEKHSD
mmetsp:Transcript_13472/g.18606  ORF Transcript_13472/g.18606 Transcript_13472/m.18606 type:complete len:282 (+) Transcript_13472:61-906(+)